MSELPDLRIRAARQEDQRLIVRLVIGAHLDPTSLKWANFLLAELDGQVVGCGQVKPYPGCRELGSLVVRKPYRRRGIGSALVRALLEREAGDVYLMCREDLTTYYERFGFQQIPLHDAPGVIKLKLLGGSVMVKLFGIRLVAMRVSL